MKSKLLPILILAFCVTMFGCAEWFAGDDDDTDCYYDDDGVRVCATRLDGGAAAAPNIYLYPESAGNISVRLTFTDEASVFTHTNPEYDDGWDVWVEPDGLIDGSYDYLYYAGELRSRFQLAEGWAVEEENVFQWFEDTMLQMGFDQNETDDFIEYWIDHLPSSPCYHIYPQDTELVNAHFDFEVNYDGPVMDYESGNMGINYEETTPNGYYREGMRMKAKAYIPRGDSYFRGWYSAPEGDDGWGEAVSYDNPYEFQLREHSYLWLRYSGGY